MAKLTLELDLTYETIDALRTLVDAMNHDVSVDTQVETSATPAKTAKATAAKKTGNTAPDKPAEEDSAIGVTLTDVRSEAAKLSKTNRDKLQEILTKYGGPPLTKVAKNDLPAVLAEIQEALNE